MAQYQGGKTFTIKRYGLGPELARWLTALQPRRVFDLTSGSGAGLEFFAQHLGERGPDAPMLVGSDLHPAAICLLRELARGWRPPTTLSEDEHRDLRDTGRVPAAGCAGCEDMTHARFPARAHACPASTDPIHGFAGFGCSFGGSYYSGYGGRSRPKYRDPVGSVAKVYVKAAPLLARVDAWHVGDFRSVYGLPGSGAVYDAASTDLVYVDIPYAGTTGYKGLPSFDHAAYWRWVDTLAVAGVTVLTSEFTAPAHILRAWYCTRQVEARTGKHGGDKAPEQDGLWVHPLRTLPGVHTPPAGPPSPAWPAT